MCEGTGHVAAGIEGGASAHGGGAPGAWRSCRYVLAYWCFLGSVCMYAMRRHLSLTIVCMVAADSTNVTMETNNVTLDTNTKTVAMETGILNYTIDEGMKETFAWTRQEQSFLLSAFFYGYLISAVPAGWAADRYGARIVIFLSVFISGLCTVLMALADTYWMMLALRTLTGFMCSAYLPAIAALFAAWAPRGELVRLVTLAQSGSFLGAAVALAMSGYLCQSFGWRSVLYVTGGICTVWSVLSLCLITSHPKHCRFISSRELEHITTLRSPPLRRQPVPWRSLFRSMPVYAFIVCTCVVSWFDTVDIIGLNLYVDDVLHMDIVHNGLYTSLPPIVNFLNMNFSVFVAQKLTTKFQKIHVRKSAQAFSGVCEITALLTMSFVTSEQWILAVFMFNLGHIGLSTSLGAGYRANLMDIAPQLAGTLTGIAGTLGLVLSLLCPLLIGYLTADRQHSGWQLVFFVSSALIFVGNIFFLVFASDKPLVVDDTQDENEEIRRDAKTGAETSTI